MGNHRTEMHSAKGGMQGHHAYNEREALAKKGDRRGRRSSVCGTIARALSELPEGQEDGPHRGGGVGRAR